jgi:hypothetical protein
VSETCFSLILRNRLPAADLHHGHRTWSPTLEVDGDEKPVDGSKKYVHIQNESPGKEKDANWLPAPSRKFILMYRL